jgi:hypothetical protein
MVALINGKNSINKYILFYLEVVGGAPLVRAATVSCRRGGVDPAPLSTPAGGPSCATYPALSAAISGRDHLWGLSRPAPGS